MRGLSPSSCMIESVIKILKLLRNMTLKRLLLSLVTLITFLVVISSLVNSWKEPQIQSRLELYQTNLLLHAAEWQPEKSQDINLKSLQNSLIGSDFLKNSLTQYETTVTSVNDNLIKIKDPRIHLKLRDFLDELILKKGVLYVANNQPKNAIKTWQELEKFYTENYQDHPPNSSIKTAQVLQGLWREPVQILPDAESKIRKNLEGWFRYFSLEHLYQLQERTDDLNLLKQEEQQRAQKAIEKLSIVAGFPLIGFIIGVGLLLFSVLQWLLFRHKANEEFKPIFSLSEFPVIPWNGETIIQVMVVGFFLVGQLLVPLGLSIVNQTLHLQPSTFTPRGQALYILTQYSLMTLGGFTVLYLSLQEFFPLPEKLFQMKLNGRWLGWGIGGYLTALPLVVIVSLFNQKLWDGQGGSNPILSIALESRDQVALVIFFITASLAAPFFEEVIFRGFLLPSLSRYVPVWGAILLSGLLFAMAHLNISEVLPLTVLGIVLGFIYVRSGNLLSSMIVHALWNSGTLMSLFILGSGLN